MPNQAKRCQDLVKLARFEIELAAHTAIDRYGMNADGHIVWHCLKPWLRGRDLNTIRHGVSDVLIPYCYERPGWEHVMSELLVFMEVSNLQPMDRISSCTLCLNGL